MPSGRSGPRSTPRSTPGRSRCSSRRRQPERVSALIVDNTSARGLWADDYPIGIPQDIVDAIVETVASLWGTEEFLAITNPERALDPELARAYARRLRAAATPHNAAAQVRYFMETIDVRSILPSIQAPTLVLHARENPQFPVAHGQYLADHIPGARLVEVPGRGLAPDDDVFALIVEEIAVVLTGERPVVETDRLLTTVMFTDIVASTERLASRGDRRWRATLDAHDRAVRELLHRFRGREVNTTGDGFHACFDGPGRAIACARSIVRAARDAGPRGASRPAHR